MNSLLINDVRNYISKLRIENDILYLKNLTTYYKVNNLITELLKKEENRCHVIEILEKHISMSKYWNINLSLLVKTRECLFVLNVKKTLIFKELIHYPSRKDNVPFFHIKIKYINSRSNLIYEIRVVKRKFLKALYNDADVVQFLLTVDYLKLNNQQTQKYISIY